MKVNNRDPSTASLAIVALHQAMWETPGTRIFEERVVAPLKIAADTFPDLFDPRAIVDSVYRCSNYRNDATENCFFRTHAETDTL